MREVMSFGGGVQSTALALMAIDRDPRLLAVTGGRVPEVYLFADTGDEPAGVYANVEQMARRIEDSGAQFMTVFRYDDDRRVLSEGLLGRMESGKDSNLPWVPAFAPGPLQRRCTFNYKVEALDRATKKWAGVPRGHKRPMVRKWLGISHDEMSRMKDSREPWAEMFYPLVHMAFRRGDCAKVVRSAGLVPVRSACVYCPFRSNREWSEMKRERPADFAAAVAFERRLHAAYDSLQSPVLRQKPFLHRSMQPLDSVRFDQQLGLPLGMDNECAGVCGV